MRRHARRFGAWARARGGVEDSVSYAVGHRIRIEILAALHEGPESADGLARIVGRGLSIVTYHIEELLKDGSIEVAYSKPIRTNMSQYFYRMVELPEFSEEEIAAMIPEERQALAALISQAATAELLASLWAGKLHTDPRVKLIWDRLNLDEQGREDLADEQAESWGRVRGIAGDAANRMAESGEKGVTYVVHIFGYERSRSTAPTPLGLETN